MVKKYLVQLDNTERQLLRDVMRLTDQPARLVRRCRMLLMADEGRTDAEIAVSLECSISGVATVRRRFATAGLQRAIYDAPRNGAPAKFTDEQLMQIVKLAATEPPDGQDRWTLESLVDESVRRGIVKTISIGRIYELLKEHDRLPRTIG